MTKTLSGSVFLATERTKAELDIDYAPSRFVGGDLGPVIADWNARTAAAKRENGARFMGDLVFGSHPREKIDFYRAESDAPCPLLVFIHGGFWQNVSKDQSGTVVGTWTKRGFHVAVTDYTLAPEATLSTMVAQTRAALAYLFENAKRLGIDATRVVAAGHSAGGHLAAMACLAENPVPLAGVLLLSGVFELAPIRQCYVNDKVQMTEDDVARLSPSRHAPTRPLPIVVAVGENEPIAFHEQSRAIAWAWRDHGCDAPPLLISRRHHFDILDDLADPHSVLGEAIETLSGRNVA